MTIVPKDSYHWSEIMDETYDLVYSANTFQHIDRFWLTVKEIQRVLKKNGIFFLIAPSMRYNGKYPVANWAFNQNGLCVLAKWAGLEVIDASVAGVPSADVGPEWDDLVDDGTLIALDGHQEENPFFKQVEKLSIQRYRRNNNMVKAEMLVGWLKIRQSTGRGISQWFEERHIRQLNIYGAGVPGKLLTEELTSAGIEILNILDRTPGKKCGNFTCCSPDSVRAEERGELTVITMSEDATCQEVSESLAEKGFGNIRLLSEIVKEVLAGQGLTAWDEE